MDAARRRIAPAGGADLCGACVAPVRALARLGKPPFPTAPSTLALPLQSPDWCPREDDPGSNPGRVGGASYRIAPIR